jgi:hypothetical protein
MSKHPFATRCDRAWRRAKTTAGKWRAVMRVASHCGIIGNDEVQYRPFKKISPRRHSEEHVFAGFDLTGKGPIPWYIHYFEDGRRQVTPVPAGDSAPWTKKKKT